MPPSKPDTLGLSQSEISVYISLLSHAPQNGSQLSRHSGVPRANIYDVLRSMKHQGLVVEIQDGRYIPLPPEEFYKRLEHRFDIELTSLKNKIESTARDTSIDYVWTIRGYEAVMAKSREMIETARRELYVLLYPPEAEHLDPYLKEAEERGVLVKYVSMGPPRTEFELQVVHPVTDEILHSHQGRVFDLVRDKIEILVGLFERDREDESPINWARNHWFVMAIREGIRHDFFHYFVHKVLDKNEPLTEKERKLYQLIKDDAWHD